MKLDVIKLDNKPLVTLSSDEDVFGKEVRKDILHRMVTWQLVKRRAGTHKAKDPW